MNIYVYIQYMYYTVYIINMCWKFIIFLIY